MGQENIMNNNHIIKRLEVNKVIFETLLNEKKENEYLWRPNPQKWCLLEIICHLFDEEREDFRTRVKLVLEGTTKELPQFNPEGWVLEHNYLGQNYDEKVVDFLNEREKSIIWLSSLENANWDNEFIHPKRGAMSAKLFLTNWVAHDYLHIRQIIKYQYQYLKEQTHIDLQYAGNW